MMEREAHEGGVPAEGSPRRRRGAPGSVGVGASLFLGSAVVFRPPSRVPADVVLPAYGGAAVALVEAAAIIISIIIRAKKQTTTTR